MEIGTNIQKAASFINAGDVVAIPTETVYGLAASILSEKGIQKIYELKGRPKTNPLIIHVASIEEISKWVEVWPEKAKILADAFMPGPITLVMPKSNKIPHYVTSGQDTVGIRVPNHPLFVELLKSLPAPLAAPSANPSNATSATQAKHVFSYFKNKDLPYVLDGGACVNGLESTIVGFEKNEVVIYRVGAITIEQIERLVGKVKRASTKSHTLTPGMFTRHYAPQTPLIMTDDIDAYTKQHPEANVAILYTGKKKESSNVKTTYINLSESDNLEEVGQRLYATLLALDEQSYDALLIQPFPSTDLGITLNDRLTRATTKK
ncbi:L-threonylcarbamoyladenylate synthase [Flavobacterium sp.]|uniref:L-threonylcarbamoyladenylate synthase n=1 Tax=Flavobacterium sp. TaxID=239 RepID=UPI0035B16B2D